MKYPTNMTVYVTNARKEVVRFAQPGITLNVHPFSCKILTQVSSSRRSSSDLICCDSCSRVFHSNCHKPKIYSLPEGEWTCMYCTKPRPSREKKSGQKPRYNDSMIALLGEKNITVTVKWPTLHCHVCDGAESKPNFIFVCYDTSLT